MTAEQKPDNPTHLPQVGVDYTMRYNAIPVKLVAQKRCFTPTSSRKQDAKLKWRRFVRDDPRYTTLVEWYDDLVDEPRYEGDQLCKQYWLSAKAETKDRTFWQEMDQLKSDIEFVPMSKEDRDWKFENKKVVKYDHSALQTDRKRHVDEGSRPPLPVPHKWNPASIDLKTGWLEHKKASRDEKAANPNTKWEDEGWYKRLRT